MIVETLPSQPDTAQVLVQKATDVLRRGEILIAPTETAYGLLVDADNSGAVRRLFALKGRAPEHVTAVFVRSPEAVMPLAEVSQAQLQGIQRFWPGPVTFVVKARRSGWFGVVTADGRIGFRCSSHPFLRALTEAYPAPLTATSANLSGRECRSGEELRNLFAEYVELMIIDKSLTFGAPLSTVVDLTVSPLRVLRVGAVAPELIREAFANGPA